MLKRGGGEGGVGEYWAGVRVARAGGERTWSRAEGQSADERGFTIRHDCILFIFSRTFPTRRRTDRQRHRETDRDVDNQTDGQTEKEPEKHN